MNKGRLSAFKNPLIPQRNKFRTSFSSSTTTTTTTTTHTHTNTYGVLHFFCQSSVTILSVTSSSFHLIFPILCLLCSYWCVHYFFYTPPFFSAEARSRLAFSGFSFLWYIRCCTTCQVICLTFRTLCHSAVILLSSADLTTLPRRSTTLLSVCSEGLCVVHQTALFSDVIRTH